MYVHHGVLVPSLHRESIKSDTARLVLSKGRLEHWTPGHL